MKLLVQAIIPFITLPQMHIKVTYKYSYIFKISLAYVRKKSKLTLFIADILTEILQILIIKAILI